MPEQKGIYSIIPITAHNHSNLAQGGNLIKGSFDTSIINSKFRVYRANVQSIPADTETIIEFTNKTYDPLSIFNITTYKFTCPYSGMWIFSVYLTIGTVVANYQLNIRFINQASTIISQCWKPLITGIGINSVNFEDIQQLSVSNTIQVQVLCSNALTLQGGEDRTFFTARWFL